MPYVALASVAFLQMVVDVSLGPGLTKDSRKSERMGTATVLPVKRATAVMIVASLPSGRHVIRQVGPDRIAAIADQTEVVVIETPARQAADAVTGVSSLEVTPGLLATLSRQVRASDVVADYHHRRGRLSGAVDRPTAPKENSPRAFTGLGTTTVAPESGPLFAFASDGACRYSVSFCWSRQ